MSVSKHCRLFHIQRFATNHQLHERKKDDIAELSLQVLQCVRDTLMLDPSNAYTRAAAIETLGCGLIVKLLDGDGKKQVQRQGSVEECCNIFRF
jgi:hypothetical protein